MAELSSENRQALENAIQLAIARHQSGDLSTAEMLYGNVLTVNPRHAVALHNLALIRSGRGDVGAALQLLEAAVQENPREPVFLFNLGCVRQNTGDGGGAAQAYRKALKLKPDYREAWENLGVVLQDDAQYDAAADAYRKALRIARCSPVARKNLANVLRVQGRLDAAETQYREALDCNPLNADIGVQYGTARLARGDFSAWPWYEWRHWSGEWLLRDTPCHVPLPQWHGEDLAGANILLYGEQGIGDEIMFAACIDRVASRAAQTTLLCEPRLAPLFARSFPNIAVAGRPRGNLPPVLNPQRGFDLRCSLASLPARLNLQASDLSGRAYLHADATATARWRERLAGLGARLTVGLAWRGGISPQARAARSIDLEALAPLFALPGVRIVNLQYGDHGDEVARFNASSPVPLVTFDEIDPLRDMDAFAALVAALDHVVTIDNSTVHLAGALGVPTALLLPAYADWRWLQERSDNIWYASVRLFRQNRRGGNPWTGAVAAVRDALAAATPRDHTAAPMPPAVQDHTPPPVCTAPNALLLNDTAYWYHWGCTCTSLALHAELRARGYGVDPVPITDINALVPLPGSLEAFDDDAFYRQFCDTNAGLIARMQAVDVIVVNGEGSIHDLGRTALALLYLAYIARQRLGKHTRIVNHSGYPTAEGEPSELAAAIYRKVYGVLDFVAVREEYSRAALAQLGVEAAAAFDCLPLYIARHPPYAATADGARRVVIAGSVQLTQALVNLLVCLAEAVHQRGYRVEVLVGANAWLAQDDVLLVEALHARLRGRYTLVAATSEAQWLQTLAGADLLISGRFHHSIAAACLGTPLVITASNTRKIDGLLERLGLAAETVWIAPDDPDSALRRVTAVLADPDTARVDQTRLTELRELAQCNFNDLTPISRGN